MVLNPRTRRDVKHKKARTRGSFDKLRMTGRIKAFFDFAQNDRKNKCLDNPLSPLNRADSSPYLPTKTLYFCGQTKGALIWKIVLIREILEAIATVMWGDCKGILWQAQDDNVITKGSFDRLGMTGWIGGIFLLRSGWYWKSNNFTDYHRSNTGIGQGKWMSTLIRTCIFLSEVVL